MKRDIVEVIKEYKDESLDQGLEFNCSVKTFTEILEDLIMYIEVVRKHEEVQ